MNMNGVIETATGDLIRKGKTDFENDGSFDPNTETFVADIPSTLMVKRYNKEEFHRWNGASWTLKSHTAVVRKSRDTILAEVFDSADPGDQLARLLNGLDNFPSVIPALDNHNYPIAYDRIDKSRIAGNITQADMDLVVSKFPEGWDA